jgi:hypothetical protein
VHRHPGVDHGVHQHDVPAGDLRVEVLQEADSLVVLAVARELDEVEVVVDRDGPRQVADERQARLQRADEQRLPAGVVAGQLGAELADAAAELVRIEEDLADALVALDQRAQEAFCSPYRTARRSKSRS